VQVNLSGIWITSSEAQRLLMSGRFAAASTGGSRAHFGLYVGTLDEFGNGLECVYED
jgi:hypothetical protein